MTAFGSASNSPSSGTPCPCKNQVREGLEGVIAAKTSVSTVGIPEIGLTYRGYPINQLIEKSTFEEVAWILVKGELPCDQDMMNFKSKIAQGRILSLEMKSLCEIFDHNAHPMDVIRTAVSYFPTSSCCDAETHIDRAGKLLGLLPAVVCYWYNYSHFGRKIDTVASVDVSVAEHFLRCLTLAEPSRLSIDSLDKTLIAYGEHDLNASTFSARVTASTLADFHCCIVSAVDTLKGPLHGGANQAALELLEKFPDEESVTDILSGMLSRKEKVMGFGHRVYKKGDPRHFIMKGLAKELAECEQTVNQNPKLFGIADKLEKEMIERKNIFPNLDFFAAVVYQQLAIPTTLFTVLFAIGRTAGWTAHIEEQWKSNKLIRPKSLYVGEPVRPFTTNLTK